MGHRTASAVTFFTAIILSASADAQTTRYVDDANCPGPGSGTEADPFCKIQDGIDAAVRRRVRCISPALLETYE